MVCPHMPRSVDENSNCFFCVFMNTGVGRVVCSSTPPHWGQTGEVGILDRPIERPGYAQIARARPTTTQGPARCAGRSLFRPKRATSGISHCQWIFLVTSGTMPDPPTGFARLGRLVEMQGIAAPFQAAGAAASTSDKRKSKGASGDRHVGTVSARVLYVGFEHGRRA